MVHFLFAWLLACMYVMKVKSLKLKGRLLKTRNISIFLLCGFSHFLLEVHQSPFLSTLPWLHVCLHVCMCMDSKFIDLQNVVSSGF